MNMRIETVGDTCHIRLLMSDFSSIVVALADAQGQGDAGRVLIKLATAQTDVKRD
jgi:hypothetical protein